MKEEYRKLKYTKYPFNMMEYLFLKYKYTTLNIYTNGQNELLTVKICIGFNALPHFLKRLQNLYFSTYIQS